MPRRARIAVSCHSAIRLYTLTQIWSRFRSVQVIRDIVKQHVENLVISFISGPSRTGNIELKLTLGVHGPREAHVVIIGNQSRTFKVVLQIYNQLKYY